MIPPEPEPVIPEYTYSSSEPITVGSASGVLYRDIQSNGVGCKLTTSIGANTYEYNHLILYDVDGTHYCYFARGTTVLYGILGNNAEIGLTVNTYQIVNGQVYQSDSQYVESSTPSDYFENARTRNFTLVQRS